MPRLPRTSAANIVKTLEKMGFKQVRQKGSHIVLRKDNRGCVIPLHKEVAVGTLAGALRQAHVSSEEFMSFYK